MIKKIAVSQLRVGMHVCRLDGSWIDHPFWRSKFTIRSDKELSEILACNITEAWIDTGRGVDVPATDATAAEPDPMPAAAPAGQPQEPQPQKPATFDSELRQAVRICRRARDTVSTLFGEARLGQAVSAEAVQSTVAEIAASVDRNAGALISLARLKTADDYTYMHSVAVCALMIALARQLGLDDTTTRLAGVAGLLHDIGKIAIPDAILNKPGRLTGEEFEVVKRHPAEGWRLLANSAVAPEVLDVVRHHHEKMDGTGYPDALDGSQISLLARMGAVCDVYDAITSNRAYKAGWDPAESISRMAEWADGHFDLPIFRSFVKCVGIYPVGSLVRLKSGRLAVVIEQNARSLLTPRVKVFYSTCAHARIVPEIVDLAQAGCQEKIEDREDPEKWGFHNLHELLPLSPGAPA